MCTYVYNRQLLSFIVELEKSSEKLLQKSFLLETKENSVEKSVHLIFNESSLRNSFLSLFSYQKDSSSNSLQCNDTNTATTSVNSANVESVSGDICNTNVVDNAERCAGVSPRNIEVCSFFLVVMIHQS